jgi:hypothetical protein
LSQNAYTLKHASVELKSDRDIVLAAVSQNAYTLKYASVELKVDGDVLIVAVAKGWFDFDENLRNSMETFIGGLLLQFDYFLDAFLPGWNSPCFISSKKSKVAPLIASL